MTERYCPSMSRFIRKILEPLHSLDRYASRQDREVRTERLLEQCQVPSVNQHLSVVLIDPGDDLTIKYHFGELQSYFRAVYPQRWTTFSLHLSGMMS